MVEIKHLFAPRADDPAVCCCGRPQQLHPRREDRALIAVSGWDIVVLEVKGPGWLRTPAGIRTRWLFERQLHNVPGPGIWAWEGRVMNGGHVSRSLDGRFRAPRADDGWSSLGFAGEWEAVA